MYTTGEIEALFPPQAKLQKIMLSWDSRRNLGRRVEALQTQLPTKEALLADKAP